MRAERHFAPTYLADISLATLTSDLIPNGGNTVYR